MKDETLTLTDRYIWAVSQSTPVAAREELERELRSSIEDAIDARVEAGEERAGVERAVLTEMGDPDRLAAEYAGRPVLLLGPRYYFLWWRLLKLLLKIVLPLAAAGILVGQVLAGAHPLALFGSVFGLAFTVGVHLVFWTTLTFVLLDRGEAAMQKKESDRDRVEDVYAQVGDSVKDDDTFRWTVDKLPNKTVSRGELFWEQIVAAAFLVIGAAALIWQQVAPPVATADGMPVPVLNPEAWSGGWLLALVILMGLELIFALTLIVRGWTLVHVIVNVVLGALSIAVMVWALEQGVLNPAFAPAIGWDLAEDTVEVTRVIVVVVVVGITVWDVIDGVIRWRRTTQVAERLAARTR